MDIKFNDEMGLGDDEGLDEEAAEIPIHGPLRDVPTRCNSTLKMLQIALLLRKGLNATCSSREWRSSEITEEEWKLIEEAVERLKPFETATRLVEGIIHPTLVSFFHSSTNYCHSWIPVKMTQIDQKRHGEEHRQRVRIKKY